MTPSPSCPTRRPGHRLALPVAAVAVLAGAGGGLALVPPAGACACGVAYGATVAEERALLRMDGGREQIVLSLDLARPATPAGTSARRPAVVFPVPATPTVTALSRQEARVFDELGRATAPRRDQGANGGDGGAPTAAPVRVLSRAVVGGYDVTRLRASDGDALRRWLQRNGYRTPAAAAPALRDYVRRDWAFVAIRLAAPVPGGGDRSLRPLRIAFRTPRMVYPLRLSAASSRPVSVRLFVAGPHRVVAKGFDTYHAGYVGDLRPAPSPAVRGLLAGQPYLTELAMVRKPPTAITGDVRPERAVSDRLFRATDDYPFESEAGFATAPLPSAADAPEPFEGPGGRAWLLLIPGVAVLVGLVALVLRTRMPGG